MELVADIGSTNARFALVAWTAAGVPALSRVASLPCAGFPSLAEVIAAYLATIPISERPTRGMLAVAGPVTGDVVKLTNLGWTFSTRAMAQQLGFAALHVINDFTAISLSLPSLPPTARTCLGPDIEVAEAACFGVVGPGTGLGVGALLRVGDRVVALPSEGGHASFAPVTDVEDEIARVLRGRFGHVSNERLLSGSGLVNIYEALNEIDGTQPHPFTPREIAEHAVAASDPVCRDALSHFCAILGAVAGDLALLLYADVIYIAGGIVPQFLDFIRASAFRKRFESKGRFAQRMAVVPTYVITEPNPGLLGAAVDLRQRH
jgi:glucokinase